MAAQVKKVINTPTRSTRNTSLQIVASFSSIGVRGATNCGFFRAPADTSAAMTAGAFGLQLSGGSCETSRCWSVIITSRICLSR